MATTLRTQAPRSNETPVADGPAPEPLSAELLKLAEGVNAS